MAATGHGERISERSGTASGQRNARRDRRWEPADTVVALATGLLVIIFAIFALLIWRGVDTSIEQARQRALTGAEVVVAGGTSALSQKVLEAIFGDQAVRTLAAKAREGLMTRVRGLLDEESGRFGRVLAPVSPPPGQVSELDAAVRELERAR